LPISCAATCIVDLTQLLHLGRHQSAVELFPAIEGKVRRLADDTAFLRLS
jgi:hypothetical protein